MNLKIFTLFIFLLLSTQNTFAKKNSQADFLLKANEQTSFMHYEFHSLAYEAAEKKHYEDTYRIYLKLANKGDNRAEYNIGMMYMKGLGINKNKMDAYKWLRRASKHGNKEATLYFQKMNERYSKKTKKVLPKATSKPEKEVVTKPISYAKDRKIVEKDIITKNTSKSESNGSNLIYIIFAFIAFMLILAFVFLKKSNKEEDTKATKNKFAKNSLAYKSYIYDITYSYVSEYHSALLKHVNIEQIHLDKHKLQIYYMFIYGVIDYFCQLEKLTDAEQRRMFKSHMGELEGKKSITSITQTILKGQKDASMYHFQAAGGISAQAWHEHKAEDALSMLKKVFNQPRH